MNRQVENTSGSAGGDDATGRMTGGTLPSWSDRLLGSDGWSKALDQFSSATGLCVAVFDHDGRLVIAPFTPTRMTRMLNDGGCWQSPDGVAFQAARALARRAVASRTVEQGHALSILRIVAIPLCPHGVAVGAVVAGWTTDAVSDPISVERLARQTGLKFDELWEVMRDQPPISSEKLLLYTGLLRTLTDLFMRERVETLREQEQSRIVAALYSSAQRLAAASTVEEIGEATVDGALSLSSSRSARLLVVDRDGRWRIAATRGFGSEAGILSALLPAGVDGRARRVPIVAADGSLLAILETDTGDPDADGQQSARISTIAAQTAIALQKTRLVSELEDERAALEKANRMKDEFLSVLSHELRTPLTPIMSWVAILHECGNEDQELLEEGLQAIDRNVKQEMSIIEELLDLTRILNNKVRLEAGVVDPRAALAIVARFADDIARERNIAVVMNDGEDVEPVWADHKRVQQILTNLVSNAIKFTPEGGTITLSARPVPGGTEFVVADTGIGISSTLLPDIFERFLQGDSSTTRRHGGLGIGLSVVRGLAELQGGRVRAESDGEGLGSTFVVRLPSASIAQVDEAGARNEENATARDRRASSRRVARILIVDDAPDTLSSLRHLIERAGYEVETAASVDAGISSAVDARPALVISDLGMPDADGFDLLRRMKCHPELSEIPVIALTGFVSAQDREAVLSAGFIQHVAKPFDPYLLLDTIDGVLGRDDRGNVERTM